MLQHLQLLRLLSGHCYPPSGIALRLRLLHIVDLRSADYAFAQNTHRCKAAWTAAHEHDRISVVQLQILALPSSISSHAG